MQFAKVANLSPRQFNRASQMETGQPPAGVAERLRVGSRPARLSWLLPLLFGVANSSCDSSSDGIVGERRLKAEDPGTLERRRLSCTAFSG